MTGIPTFGYTQQELSEKTTDKILNASFKDTTADERSVFVEWVIPDNVVIRLIDNQGLQLKVYAAGGTEPEKGQLSLVFKRPQDALYKEICQLGDYSTYKSITWAQQLSLDFKDQEKVRLGYPLIIAFTGEIIGLMINTSTVLPTSPHAQTKIKYPFWHISTGDYNTFRMAKIIAEEREKRRKGRKGSKL